MLARLAARTESVRLCEVVHAVENAAAGLLGRAAAADVLARVLHAGMAVRPGRVEMGNERRVWVRGYGNTVAVVGVFIDASMRSAILCTRSRSCQMVKSAA